MAHYLDRFGLDVSIPNVKRMLRPDPGYYICDVDLEQADAQVVAWESGCERLKKIFRDPDIDLHDANTEVIFGKTRAMIGSLDENGVEFTKGDFVGFRQQTKGGVHGTNYRGTAPTIAKALGISVQEAEVFQRVWFEQNPEILDWHLATEMQILEHGYIQNKFGFRRTFFGRVDPNLLNEAQAWVPQSTVGNVINKGWQNIEERINGKILSGPGYWKHSHKEHVKILLQVHDSLVMQFKFQDTKELLPEIKGCMLVEIPYEDPLVIGVGNPELSMRSYGEVKPYTWEGEIIG